jgi:MFS transporter, DHA2 family, multidrug resistance protein
MPEENTGPSPSPLFLLTGVLAVLLGGLLSTLNGRLLSVVLPDLRGALHLSVDEAAWIPTSYNMAIMFIGVFSVYLGALLGVRRVLLACSLIYMVASFLLPFSASYRSMLVLQVIAGLSSGTFYPLTLSFILTNLPTRIAHLGLAAYSLTILFSANIASSLSAWLLLTLSWNWVFWTLSWTAFLMFLCVYFGTPHTPLPKPNPKMHISWRGLLYWSFGLALVYGALDIGERVHWFDSPTFAALLIAGLFLVVMTILRRNQDPNPLIALPFIRDRSTILLGVVVFTFRLFLLSTALLIPQFLAGVDGLRDEQVGPVLSIVAVLQFILAWVVAFALRAVNARLLMAGGFAVIGVTAFLCSHLSAAWEPNSFIPYAVLFAAGESFAMLGMVGSIVLQVMSSGAVTTAGKLQRPLDVLTFSGFFHTVRIMGGQIGAVLMLHLLSERTKFHTAMLDQQTAPARLPVTAFLRGASVALSPDGTDPSHTVGLSGYLLGSTVRQQASTLAFADAFTVIAWSSVVVLILIAFVRLRISNFKEFV